MSAIIPAILPRTREELAAALRKLAPIAGVTVVQIDAVDGRFVASASWPYAEPARLGAADLARELQDVLAPYAGRFVIDADLMVADQIEAAEAWLAAGASRVTLHIEALGEPLRALAALEHRLGRRQGGKPYELGLAAGLGTDLARLASLIPHARPDYVQLMGIRTIGRQHEPFDARVLARVRALRARYPRLVIQVDGGVSAETTRALIDAGADRLVAGHAILGAADSAAAFASLATIAAGDARYDEAMPLTDGDVRAIAEKANEIRETIVEMLVAAGSGHTAGPLGLADIFAAFYFHILRHDPKNPEWEGRDRLILSNGHTCPVRYAAMAHAGYFPAEECLTLRKFGSRLQGHPERVRLPGLETTSGPLGEGLAQAAGMALALRMQGERNRVYCVVSDGEQDEGNTWEAALFAGKYKLGNLTAIMDRNNIQIDGVTEDVMPLEPIKDKYEAFGWHVLECSGHDIRAFVAAVEEAKAIYEKPTMIIAHTIPGRGVPEIEFDYRWHGVPPGAGPEDVWKKGEQGAAMLRELRTLGGRLPHEYA
ncbi:MAG: hypothetical protein KGI78_00665 [Patescibacteria group bacterium]|nr:hypothetical protein [Patescibacteria group bacterium]MDE1944278.1 hypothetical protein [Patescibacteria group bacterium]MDE1944665.1 hypothetical protein [Patescibacteria group bacterium]MDE2057351.1 hypothetical protein [Patescibacteria group bacterium]